MTSNKTEASIKDGLWFVYEHGNNVIKVWASGLNGKEKVYLNEKLVSEKRNFKKEYTHSFVDDNGLPYSVVLKAENLLKGIFTCSIENEGKTLKTFRASFESKRALNPRRLVIIVLLSIVYGVIHALYSLPNIYFIIFIIAIVISSIFNRSKVKINIEED